MMQITKKKIVICGSTEELTKILGKRLFGKWNLRETMKDYVTSRNDVVEELDKPFPLTPWKLQLSFWPSTSYTITKTNMFDAIQEDTTPTDNSRYPFLWNYMQQIRKIYKLL